MYVSRLSFASSPRPLARGRREARALRRGRFASLGAPGLVFEEEAPDLATLERRVPAEAGAAR
jgi:hypothetical protein